MAKKKMPKLGRKDHITYILLLIVTFGGAFFSVFLQARWKRSVAFSDPNVIACSGEGNILYLFLMIWLLFAGLIIALVFYQHRYPIFGREDISYGAPKYPSIYPLLMKNKPKVYRPKKEKERLEKYRKVLLFTAIVTFVFSAAVYPLSVFDRGVMLEDGTIEAYDALNEKTCTYQTKDIKSVRIYVDYISFGRGIFNGKWCPVMRITTHDGETYHFAEYGFEGKLSERLRTMIEIKACYGTAVQIEGTDNLGKTIRDLHMSKSEEALLHELFEVK